MFRWHCQVINKKIVAARSSAAAFKAVRSFLAQDDVLGLSARHLHEFDSVCAAGLDGVSTWMTCFMASSYSSL